jgi:hypothetical protein
MMCGQWPACVASARLSTGEARKTVRGAHVWEGGEARTSVVKGGGAAYFLWSGWGSSGELLALEPAGGDKAPVAQRGGPTRGALP